ncbi:MAG: GWxTD domain-containing protein [Bacteroidota bacterium]|jgi:GWxTD domain-containing protein|nr:GWxTD domain-containing protein [Ignavibacteria bacterium]MCU7500153.1 GWxTD domain-containing protein [Ignavibacteria bacterium]MCU7511540.1 GWxTD domain-containing protein [Ignavibacteria bacterium]MCU7521045.1 GWxTD domain-containing protein [Ignavibacteria bacterium]MCU7524334.1 GWxTD domain-containing protein [Ignavibacteria bacterium]
MKTVIILLFAMVLPLLAQTETSRGQISREGSPKFYFDAYNYRGTQPGKTRMDLYVEVPYNGIQFVKSQQGFTADYNITASIYTDDSKDKMITEKSWGESVNAGDFDATTSKDNFNLSLKSFDLPPANYFLRVEVEDRDSKKSTALESMFTVKNLDAPLAVSDVLLIQKIMEINGQKKMIPNISRNVASRKEGLMMYYEVYSDTARKVDINYSVAESKPGKEDKDEKDAKVLYTQKDTRDAARGTTPVNFSLQNAELSLGQYDLIVQLQDESSNAKAETRKRFVSRWIGMPTAINDLDKAVDEMVYIASESDLKKIKDAPTKEEKQKNFLAFWKSKDPSPSTEQNEVFEEYYRRIAYANEHFKNYMEGWRTDMGMVFITLGPPSNIERYPFEYDSKPYEIWDYYDINKRFVFVDQTGFGDYRLLDPVYGSWWKYRQ